mmetsp:Transcript_28314/g.66431  ORF Transcript_28314/g.66431 Transcript_28314/m.66431 type:complete len:84 (+) Transcript_28314:3885-4136(+)
MHLDSRYWRMRFQTNRRLNGSIPLDGSSKITVLLFPQKAMATLSFLFMPPERSLLKVFRLSRRATSSMEVRTDSSASFLGSES